MTLEERIKHILDHFDESSSKQIIEVLNQIVPQFTHKKVSEYLQKKIQTVIDADTEFEKKKVCETLRPYLDWYLQGT